MQPKQHLNPFSCMRLKDFSITSAALVIVIHYLKYIVQNCIQYKSEKFTLPNEKINYPQDPFVGHSLDSCTHPWTYNLL